MPQDGISHCDLQALRLIGYVEGRFEADAGFSLPGLSAAQITPSLAQSFGAGTIDESRLDDLAQRGLLSCVRTAGAVRYYTLSPTGTAAAAD